MSDFISVIDAYHNDPTVYPVLGPADSKLPFSWESPDGTDLQQSWTRDLMISELSGHGWTVVERYFKDFFFDVYITDSRVVFCCKKFTKGGGYRGFSVGGLLFAGVANAASHAAAASRRQGKLAVGQLRFLCLARVDTAPRVGRKRGRLLLTCKLPPGGPLYRMISFGLPDTLDPLLRGALVSRLSGCFVGQSVHAR